MQDSATSFDPLKPTFDFHSSNIMPSTPEEQTDETSCMVRSIPFRGKPSALQLRGHARNPGNPTNQCHHGADATGIEPSLHQRDLDWPQRAERKSACLGGYRRREHRTFGRLGQAAGTETHGQGTTPFGTDHPANAEHRGKPVALTNARAFIQTNQPGKLSHTGAEATLPGRFLQDYIVVLDYPAKTFTLAAPGMLKPAGTAIKTYIGRAGMPVVWLSVAGKPWGFLMDSGGQDSMISTARLDAWSKQHPDWRKVSGAYGPADMLLGGFPRARKMVKGLCMLRIGTMKWGPFDLENVSAVSRPAGIYEKKMSKGLGKPVIGSIAGNVLRHFRVTVDYPAGKVYLKREATQHDNGIDMVGIMLEPASGGGYEVVRTLPGVSHVKVGDRLLKVDGHAVTGVPFSDVVDWLDGKPGQTHRLTLERGGKSMTTLATVRTIL